MAASHGKAYLHDQLKKTDPKAASIIDPHDASRVIRALEVFELTGVSIVDQQAETSLQPEKIRLS